MAIIIDNFLQGSDLWMKEKAGNPGASDISKIITSKGERSKQRDEYMRQLAGELITGECEETVQSIHMKNGLEREGEARTLFEMIHNVDVRRVALIYKDEQKQYHVSPDGLVGDEAGIEIKCPMMKTQVKYLLDGKLPTDYFSQIQMSLYVSERKYWWFLSYYKKLPPLILRIERDGAFISKLKAELDAFCVELQITVKKLKDL